MARRRTVLTIPVPAGGVEVADVLAVLTGVAPSYDLTRIEVGSTREGENFLVLTAGQRRLRPGVLIGADPLPGLDEDTSSWGPAEVTRFEVDDDRPTNGDTPALAVGMPITLTVPDEHAWHAAGGAEGLASAVGG